MKALLGLGTNIGSLYENLTDAEQALSLVPNIRVIRTSSVYETEPWGFKEQHNFYNSVLEIETSLSPAALLGVCLGIEAGMGRVRQFKNGPRIIDIDVLLCEGFEQSSAELTVPHPFILERDFVLLPLKELFPNGIAYGFCFDEAYEKYAANSAAKIIEKN